MASYDGYYLHYEGSTANCNSLQQERELVFDLTLHTQRFKRVGGTIDTFLPVTATSTYLPMVSSNALASSLILQSSGNIGIGCTPTYFLDCQRDQNAGTTIRSTNDTSGTAAYASFMASYNTTVQYCELIQLSPLFTTDGLEVASSACLYSWGNSNGLRVFCYDDYPLVFGQNNTEVARIHTNGYFGIGTTAPDDLFHVEVADAGTSAVAYAARFSHVTSGTAAASFGVGIEFELENAAGNNQFAGALVYDWESFDTTYGASKITFKVSNLGSTADCFTFQHRSISGYSEASSILFGTHHLLDLVVSGSTPTIMIWNNDAEDIDFRFNGDNGLVCTLDAGTDSLFFYDSKQLTFGNTAASPDMHIYSDGTRGRVGLALDSDSGNVSVGELYVDNSGYVRVKAA